MRFFSWLKRLGRRRSKPVARTRPDTVRIGRQARSSDVRDPSFPHFSRSASDLSRRTQSQGLEDTRTRLRNAFTPSQPVSDARNFAGRRDLLKTVIRAIEDQQLHVVLFGDRGIGKTSLLHVIEELSRKARYIVSYHSCGEGSEFSDVFRAIASEIPLLFHTDYDPTAEEIEKGESLANLLPQGKLTVSQVSDVLAKVAGTRVLIILDEFDRSDAQLFRRPIAELIKNLSDRSVRVQLVIAGVAANLTELVTQVPSIRRNVVGIPVQIMDRDEIRQLVNIGEAHSGLRFEDDAFERIADIASGSPYLASLLSQHSGLAAVERSSSVVKESDVRTAIERTLGEVKLRVSPHNLHYIESAEKMGFADQLGDLARLALVNAGRLDQRAVARVRTSAALLPPSAQAIVDHLIERIPDDPAESFRFCEDGAGLYLWMLNAAANSRDSQTDTPRSVPA